MFPIAIQSAFFLALGLSCLVDEKPCDLKTIEDGLYCEACDELLDADAITKKEYCKLCYEEAVEAGEKPEKAKKVKVCVKVYWECPDCGAVGREGQKCEECDVQYEKITDRALVIYVCDLCGEEGEKEGPCSDPDCRADGGRFKKTCEKSGSFPHGGS